MSALLIVILHEDVLKVLAEPAIALSLVATFLKRHIARASSVESESEPAAPGPPVRSPAPGTDRTQCSRAWCRPRCLIQDGPLGQGFHLPAEGKAPMLLGSSDCAVHCA